MDVKELTEKEYEKVLELLSSAVKNKKYAQPEDLQRACVLFYSVNKLGFVLVDLDVNSIIEKSGEDYSESTKELLRHAANTCHDLVEGLENVENEEFKLKEGF
ncbi:MAG: hypothetical protein E6L04_09765 [Thaumarchaeota archaeon]|nr:MAG: hypothetical protein E6L04_09765 [Nitrososphaerota archaeon]TLX92568.1 MAG: hypothetical protein E6K97_01185 [Nitrososphaerota archaeon]